MSIFVFRIPVFFFRGHVLSAGAVFKDVAPGFVNGGEGVIVKQLAAAGDPDIKQRLLKGYNTGSMTYKVHLDGYNILPYLTGQEQKSPRREFIYFSDDCDLVGLRYENYKFVFMEQRSPGTLMTWIEPFTRLRGGKMFDLRADPYERADITSNTYYDWIIDHIFLVVPSQAYIVNFIKTFKEYPPRQKPASFGIDQALETLQNTAGGR